MRISDRLATLVSDGDGWGVFYKARALVAEGVAVTELTIGEHDIPTHPRILEEMHRAARGGHTGYAAVPGTDALRDKVAALQAMGVNHLVTLHNFGLIPVPDIEASMRRLMRDAVPAATSREAAAIG